MEIVDPMEANQRALHIATLVLTSGKACGVEDIQRRCCLFQVSSPELQELCALQDSPLQFVDTSQVGLTKNFLIELRSHLEAFERGCVAATRCNGTPFLVPAVPSASFVASQVNNVIKDGVIQDLDIKEKSNPSKRIPEFQDYVVLGEEGSGGYGTVYRVKRKRDGELFAIKCPLDKTTPEYVNHEIKMLQKVGGQEYVTHCEEVVREVHSVGALNGAKENQRPNLVLRYIEHDKPEFLRKEITIQELQLYGYCLFRALAYLHKQGIVHRDVKPGNFLFSRARGTGYLVDFNLALVTSTSASVAVKSKKAVSKPLRDSVKGESNKEARLASSKNVLGKRVRGEDDIATPKRHQTSNIRENGPQSVSRIPQADAWTRGSVSPVRTQQPSLATQCTIQVTATSNQAPNGAATSVPGEEISKKRATGDSSSKAAVVCDPIVPAQRPRQTRRYPKVVNATREPDGGPPHSVPGELAWMPQTVGVVRFANYLKNRNQSQSTITSTVPPASQRKRVAALQDKKVTIKAPVTRPPTSPPRTNKGAGVRRNLPKDGPCAGTKGYRAPEVLLKSTMQTAKLDIWSAGVSLLQLIAGKAPFPSNSSEQALKDIAKLRGVDDLLKLAGDHDCLHKLPPGFEALNHKPMSVMDWCSTHARRSEMRDRLPPDLCDLLEKCLQVNPTIRIEASEALGHEFFKSARERVTHDSGFSPTTKSFA